MKRILLFLLTMTIPGLGLADHPASWMTPVEPFRIVGNVWYVGTADLGSFLITTPEGHILLDAPMEENVSQLVGNIEKLGFDLSDIRILINSHAHFDHAGGFASIREITGAELVMSREDAALASRGGRGDFAFGDRFAYPSVQADRILNDGERISLGGTTLMAVFTPGHTRGSTSWVMDVEERGTTYRVVVANSLTAPEYRLIGNENYPAIVEDYRVSFEKLASMKADVFLAPHGSFFRLAEKLSRLGGPTNPFIDSDALRSYVDRMRESFEKELAKQR
ncbi:MAG TPA: subclass B3 metallo-beta-lactamase [Thermoanaerobaculia bacterium]|nr:subclass B3 metallo-beta-lactamase [Thermoanaerobaculia bacterium]